jgi:hypothetical protein
LLAGARQLATAVADGAAEAQLRRMFPTAAAELAGCPVAALMPVQVRGGG